MCEADDGTHNFGVAVLGDVPQEATIHFQLVDRKSPQIGQR